MRWGPIDGMIMLAGASYNISDTIGGRERRPPRTPTGHVSQESSPTSTLKSDIRKSNLTI